MHITVLFSQSMGWLEHSKLSKMHGLCCDVAKG